VPDVTNIKSAVLPELNWASRLGASCPRVGLLGTSVSVVAVPRVRGKVAFAAMPQQEDSVRTLLGQTNIHNYMTGASAVGEGASGPPPYREPV
jgi:hypothetical protein